MIRRLRLNPGQLGVLATLFVTLVLVGSSGGSIFSPGRLTDRSRGLERLGGVHSHAELSRNCSACHAPPWSRETMADRCLHCHEDVRHQLDTHAALHGSLPDAASCRNCHTEHRGAQAALTDLDRFDHAWTGFPLTGKHRAAECRSCHADQAFRATSPACASCHAEPKVHLGRFGTDCARCHSTGDWHASLGADFDHGRTAFPLTGKHRAVDCKSCHKTETFKGTSQSCASCHAEPKVHAGRFGTDCARCHTTKDWQANLGAGFDHARTAFPLTGKHQAVDCKACHRTETFKGTPQTCSACHAEPKAHKQPYGTDCAHCHTTATFSGATFKHTFPINHGQRRAGLTGNTCQTCHEKAPEFATYTCYGGCHAHQPAAMERKHRRVPQAELPFCARCHPMGRERERERGGLERPGVEELLVAAEIRDRPDCGGCPACGEDRLTRCLRDLERRLPPAASAASPVPRPVPTAATGERLEAALLRRLRNPLEP